jgi:D-alanyl-lipoteichoic acid acyltransferase DltB (MBOAT superfamily)
MLFNSIDFAIFLPIVFLLYWFVFNKSLKVQNAFIVLASYVFYGWWDWRFLFLILFSTIVDYTVGRLLAVQEDRKKRKLLLLVSIFVNLGLLGFFKYYNFFLDNFISAFSFFGISISARGLDVVLPVGISFYTFQTMSYTIDVYRKKLEPTKDFIAFTAFVSFFPQLVAGPIERATHLLPQFYKKREFDYSKAVDGLKQILWGLFKKIIIADTAAELVNNMFSNYTDYNGSSLLIGAFLFAFQIYGDFSGYSDIAIGTARLFGFDLMQNFAFPYFSRDIAEFWRRWHISLSTGFRDYVYIPLGGSRGSIRMRIRNIFIIFVLSGFWHGANWTFIIWGTLHAIYFLPLMLLNKNRVNTNIVAEGKYFPTLKETFSMILTFTLVAIALVFFRAENLTHAINFLDGMFSFSLFEIPKKGTLFITILEWLTFFIVIEWLGRENKYAIEKLTTKWNIVFRWLFYYGLVITIILNISKPEQFIYFQF